MVNPWTRPQNYSEEGTGSAAPESYAHTMMEMRGALGLRGRNCGQISNIIILKPILPIPYSITLFGTSGVVRQGNGGYIESLDQHMHSVDLICSLRHCYSDETERPCKTSACAIRSPGLLSKFYAKQGTLHRVRREPATFLGQDAFQHHAHRRKPSSRPC